MSTNQTIAQLQSTDRETVFHPSTHASDHAHGKIPVNIIQSGNGIYIKNQQGTELLDAFAGLYCVNVGYGRTEIADAIYEQAKKLAYYLLSSTCRQKNNVNKSNNSAASEHRP